MMTTQRIAPVLFLTWLLFGDLSVLQADPKTYENVLVSTTWIVNQEKQSSGSGVLIDLDSRLVVTNYHVVGQAKKVTVFFSAYNDQDKLVTDRKTYKQNFPNLHKSRIAAVGQVVARWSRKDLALIQLDQLPAEPQSLPLAEVTARPGDLLHSIGNSGKSDALWSYTPGKVRQVYAKEFQLKSQQRVDAWIVESTSPTNGGDSGGPLVNTRGELVGITSAYSSDARLVSHAIEVREVRKLLDWYYDNVYSPYSR